MVEIKPLGHQDLEVFFCPILEESNVRNKQTMVQYPRRYLDSVKVNSEQLVFNWQPGRDLVERKAEEKWGSGIVEQFSLDLQAAFPEAKGFSARNLWFMKQWYTFYSSGNEAALLISNLDNQIDTGSLKLKQAASEIF